MKRFLTQPNKRYRNFQIMFTLLTLNFLIPAITYVFSPELARRTVSDVGQILGSGPYNVPESASFLWRYLGAANVFALGFMCLILQLNLRKYHVVLVPLTFLKATAATLWMGSFLFESHYSAFLAFSLFDYLTCAAFVFFAGRAWAEIRERPDEELVPAPQPWV